VRPRASGKRIGRPRVFLDRSKIDSLQADGLSWAKIAERLGMREGTSYRAAQASKTVLATLAVNPVNKRPIELDFEFGGTSIHDAR
jgi:DNA invertase Pin-like site-specific DNA recombinase